MFRPVFGLTFMLGGTASGGWRRLCFRGAYTYGVDLPAYVRLERRA